MRVCVTLDYSWLLAQFARLLRSLHPALKAPSASHGLRRQIRLGITQSTSLKPLSKCEPISQLRVTLM